MTKRNFEQSHHHIEKARQDLPVLDFSSKTGRKILSWLGSLNFLDESSFYSQKNMRRRKRLELTASSLLWREVDTLLNRKTFDEFYMALQDTRHYTELRKKLDKIHENIEYGLDLHDDFPQENLPSLVAAIQKTSKKIDVLSETTLDTIDKLIQWLQGKEHPIKKRILWQRIAHLLHQNQTLLTIFHLWWYNAYLNCVAEKDDQWCIDVIWFMQELCDIWLVHCPTIRWENYYDLDLISKWVALWDEQLLQFFAKNKQSFINTHLLRMSNWKTLYEYVTNKIDDPLLIKEKHKRESILKSLLLLWCDPLFSTEHQVLNPPYSQ